MSLQPAFKLDVWNAWILILPIIILSLFGRKIIGNRESGTDNIYTKKEKTLFSIYMVAIIVSYTYSIFLPLKMGTIWSYIGFSFFLLGMIIGIMAMLSFATTPVDKLVTTGIYRISRNPMYISEILIYVSIGVACTSWIFLLLALVASIVGHIGINSEERFCLNKYGDRYRDYKYKTPKWIGMPTSKTDKKHID